MVRLATGQQMATFMKSKGVNFPKLSQGADPRRQERRRARRAERRSSAPRCSRTRRCGSTSCARPSSTAASCAASARASSPRRSTARSRAASSRSSATPRGGRRSARTTRPSGWSTCCCSPSRARRRCSRRSARRASARRATRAQHVAPDQARAGADEQPVEAEAGAGARVRRGDAGLGGHARARAGGLDHEVEADLDPARLGERLQRRRVERRRVLAAGQPPRLHDAAAQHGVVRLGGQHRHRPVRRAGGRRPSATPACGPPAAPAAAGRPSARATARGRASRSSLHRLPHGRRRARRCGARGARGSAGPAAGRRWSARRSPYCGVRSDHTVQYGDGLVTRRLDDGGARRAGRGRAVGGRDRPARAPPRRHQGLLLLALLQPRRADRRHARAVGAARHARPARRPRGASPTPRSGSSRWPAAPTAPRPAAPIPRPACSPPRRTRASRRCSSG